VTDLARATGTHEESLYRVLRALACVALFEEGPGRRFRLTPMSDWLRSDIPASLRVAAEAVAEEWNWRPWGSLLHSVTTGETAFDHLYGQSTWSWFDEHPGAAAIFNHYMDAITIAEARSVVSAFDFGRARTVVDVAGGQGVLLAAILRRHSHARGILFNLPSVIESARGLLEKDLSARIDLVGGDFFQSVPSGGDAYILKNIIHDWDDERAREILESCRRAMGAGEAVLLVIEHVVRPTEQSYHATMSDVQMLVRTGGRNRTEQELEALLTVSRFRVRRTIPTAGGPDIVEASPIS
jgi:hypothetical protein